MTKQPQRAQLELVSVGLSQPFVDSAFLHLIDSSEHLEKLRRRPFQSVVILPWQHEHCLSDEHIHSLHADMSSQELSRRQSMTARYLSRLDV
mgnify:FL=1